MKKLTNKEFIEKSKIKHVDLFDYSLSEYINDGVKVKIICKIHGIFEQRPNSHLQGIGCKKCGIKNGNVKRNNKEFIKNASEIHNNKYDYSKVKYVNNKVKVEIICLEHGIFEQTPNSHLKKRGCPFCSSIKSNTENFIAKSNIIHDDKYDYSMVNYKNARTKVEIICNKHGIFNQLPNNHLKGIGCPVCKCSKGELKIIKLLEKNNIKYICQKTFNECIFKKKLPFDFYLPDYNICIEYNGEQHYKIIENWGGLDNFIIRQERDKIKKEYCLINNIPLITISYLDSIESIFSSINLFICK